MKKLEREKRERERKFDEAGFEMNMNTEVIMFNGHALGILLSPADDMVCWHGV